MTTPSTNGADGQAQVIQPLLDFWRQCFEQGQEQSRAWLDGARAAFDPAALRRRWLQAVAETLDRYMRTPAFLEALRRNFEAVTQVKGTAEDWARDLSRAAGVPRIEDVSGLFERLQIGQEAILARLDDIEQRLAARGNRKGETKA